MVSDKYKIGVLSLLYFNLGIMYQIYTKILYTTIN